jgi:hypothetical protein
MISFFPWARHDIRLIFKINGIWSILDPNHNLTQVFNRPSDNLILPARLKKTNWTSSWYRFLTMSRKKVYYWAEKKWKTVAVAVPNCWRHNRKDKDIVCGIASTKEKIKLISIIILSWYFWIFIHSADNLFIN